MTVLSPIINLPPIVRSGPIAATKAATETINSRVSGESCWNLSNILESLDNFFG